MRPLTESADLRNIGTWIGVLVPVTDAVGDLVAVGVTLWANTVALTTAKAVAVPPAVAPLARSTPILGVTIGDFGTGAAGEP